MKRSTVNKAIISATEAFTKNGWVLPPSPKWDVTDFGLGNFAKEGLVLINLAEEVEYCEKLMYAAKDQTTPAHCHKKKKEDIISRNGTLVVKVWSGRPDEVSEENTFEVQVNGKMQAVKEGEEISLPSGHRITLIPGVYHAFWPSTDYCIIGEVSTANDDLNDNFFINPNIGRYSEIEEDEAPLLKLLSDK